MQLYGYYRSSASYRIRIVLNFKGVSWEYLPVMLDRGEQQGAVFSGRNPMGLVPLLVDRDIVLSQSGAIAEYLEDRYPSPPLLPANPHGRAQVREMQGIIGCDVHPLQNLRVLKYLRAEFAQDDAGVEAWCRHWIRAGFTALEILATKRSSDGRYCFGASPTLADAWLLPQIYNANRFDLALGPFPTLAGIARHCETLPAFADAHPARQPDAAPGPG